jgi:RNA polymerase sigma-70 factor (ECF subfamily)
LPTFRYESSFYTWLRKITINCFLNHRRSAKAFPWQRRQSDDTAIEDYAIKSDAGRAAKRLEITTQNQLAVQKVMRALGKVTPQQRLAFLLKHQEEMTYEEISRELGCSIGTVKKSVSRTIAKLREQLGVNDEPESFVPWAATGILR